MSKLKKILFVIVRKCIHLLDYFSARKYMVSYNWYLRKIGIDIKGTARYIHPTVVFDGLGYSLTHIGNNAVISRDVLLLNHDASITCGMRALKYPFEKEAYWLKDITIGDDCFIGARSILLPGTEIGDNCIIGSGTVIKGKVPSNSVVVGNPARVVAKTTEWAERKIASDIDLFKWK